MMEAVVARDGDPGEGAPAPPSPPGKKVRQEEVVASIDFGGLNLAYIVMKVVAERRRKKEGHPPCPPGQVRMVFGALAVTGTILEWRRFNLTEPLKGSMGETEADLPDAKAIDVSINFVANGYRDLMVARFAALGVDTILYEEQLGPSRFSPGNPTMFCLQAVCMSSLAARWRRTAFHGHGASGGWVTYKRLAADNPGLGLAEDDVKKPPGSRDITDKAKKKIAVKVAGALVKAQAPAQWQEFFQAYVDARKADDVADVLLQVGTHYRVAMGLAQPKAPPKASKNKAVRRERLMLTTEAGVKAIPVSARAAPGFKGKTKPAKEGGVRFAPSPSPSPSRAPSPSSAPGGSWPPWLAPARDQVVVYCLACLPGCGSKDGLGGLKPGLDPASLPPGSSTYFGFTVNLHTRVRQHNKMIKGGAKRTSGGAPDNVLAYFITGFPADHNYSVAMSFEHATKKAKVSGSHPATTAAAKTATLRHPRLPICVRRTDAVLRRDRWTSACKTTAAACPLTLHWVWPLAPCPIDPATLPPHVAVVDHTK